METEERYSPSERVATQIKKAFDHHILTDDATKRCKEIREVAGELAHFIACNSPESREQSLALTSLEDAVFWANAAIARNEK